MVEKVIALPDHLEVAVFGAPKLNVTLAEVGLGKQAKIAGVGGGTRSFWYQALASRRVKARCPQRHVGDVDSR